MSVDIDKLGKDTDMLDIESHGENRGSTDTEEHGDSREGLDPETHGDDMDSLPSAHQESHSDAELHEHMMNAIRDSNTDEFLSLFGPGLELLNEHHLLAAAEKGLVRIVEKVGMMLSVRDEIFRKNYELGLETQIRPARFGPPPLGIGARPWTKGVCDHCAEQGKLTALKTLIRGGCAGEMDSITLFSAAKGGSEECVRCGSSCYVAQCFFPTCTPRHCDTSLRHCE